MNHGGVVDFVVKTHAVMVLLSSNSEAFASELVENLEEMFH